MKKIALLFFLFLFINSFSQGLDDDHRILNQFIVMLKPAGHIEELTKTFPSLQVKGCLSKQMNIWLLERSSSIGAEDFLTALQKNGSVKLVQFNHRIQQRAIIPDDPYFSLQWNMLNNGSGGGIRGADIDATDAWQMNHNNLTVNGDSIVVAIIDGTFDLTHPDLNFFYNYHSGSDDNGYIGDSLGWNVYDNSGNINDGGGQDHAMHCSGIAGAITNNDTGIAGVCWGVKILRVSGASQTESEVVAAYAYVVAMRALYNRTHGALGAFIVSTNSSFGVGDGGAQPSDYPIWCAMYDSMGAYGVLSAAAAPDAFVDVDEVGDVPTGCPSNYLITVTNTTAYDSLYPQAAIGKITIDIGAPGTHIYSTITGGQYGFMTGTSMSSPHLAGTVASMYAAACPQLINDYYAYPDSIALVVKQLILDGATRISELYNETLTGGRLNLYHAVKNLEEYNCNRCKDTVAISVAQPTCSYSCDGMGQLSVSGSGNHSYNWSTETDTTSTARNLCPGFYSVTITDTAGCQQVRNFSLFSPDSLMITSINTIPAVYGNPGNIIITAIAGNYALAYSLDGVNYQEPPSNDQTITFPINTNGYYTVYVKSENGCVVEHTFDITAGIENILKADNWSIYPNPASSSLNISFTLPQNAEVKFSMMNVLGEIVLEETKQIPSGNHTATADVSYLTDGIYFLQISAGAASSTRKFVIAK